MDGWKDGMMEEWMNGRMAGRVDGRRGCVILAIMAKYIQNHNVNL